MSLRISMAGEIKLFLLNKKYYRIAGIDTHESYQNSHSLNSKKWIFMAVYVLYALPSASFFVLEAKYIVEYSISLFAILTAYAGKLPLLHFASFRTKISIQFSCRNGNVLDNGLACENNMVIHRKFRTFYWKEWVTKRHLPLSKESTCKLSYFPIKIPTHISSCVSHFNRTKVNQRISWSSW